MKKIATLLPLMLLSLFLQAQMTGSFQKSINFQEADYNFTRTLYYQVPTDYDSNQAYKLVIGFRGGPNSNAGQFRDQLSFLADSINAIVVCPENIAHFNSQEGLTKQLFQYSLDTISAEYNIDPNFIYLTGLSFGGRHAVIVSMDTDDGPIPNLRGVIPFAAGSNSHLQPNYDDIDQFPPACVCIGLSDSENFKNVANSLHNDILMNGGVSLLNEISGVGHTVAFPSFPEEMMECFNFIEAQYQTASTEELAQTLAKQVQLYPNPADQIMEISYPNTIVPIKLYIADITGRNILDLALDQQSINLSNLPSGLKHLIIVTKETRISKTFSVIH